MSRIEVIGSASPPVGFVKSTLAGAWHVGIQLGETIAPACDTTRAVVKLALATPGTNALRICKTCARWYRVLPDTTEATP